ncbi:hypothetical protein [Streptomyces sp. SP18BB07]|uniref:hypothetical protein n=1 Tax=Streptomyces sp. SP18BB07 TaxID=3002522 RepID=UPI002E79D684|nr:hypothetical protein [Streptomyces sp. SP18BB07]MEE1764373.1 hypothetical protein [Streptomyces sp. SP18BB07]
MPVSETPEPTAEEVVKGLFEETGLRPSLIPVYTAAVLALRDREKAAELRAAGFTAAAAHLEPDPAAIAEAFGPEDH